jgi:F1F0 ATPase subunit 2
MNFPPSLCLLGIFLAGFGVSLFYFGGLWVTVQQLPATNHPYRLVFVSFLLRLILVLLCFYFLFNQLPLLSPWKFLGMLLLGCWLGRRIWIISILKA